MVTCQLFEGFLGQPMFVAEKFHGLNGKYVQTRDTVRGFREILDGKHDALPEQAFYMVGGIEEVIEKAKQRLGKKSLGVNWIVSDINEFVPTKKYDLWHDIGYP